MNKTKILIKSIGNYLRELSVVVTGVAITVTTGLWLNNRNNEKDIQLYLENIKMELQNNLEDIYVLQDYYSRTARYSDYLSINEMQNLHPDTLSQYDDLAEYFIFFTYRTNAFDMIKTSGIMRLMKDKKKVMYICHAYDMLESIRAVHEFYTERKIAVVEHFNGYAKGRIESEFLLEFYSGEMNRSWVTFFTFYIKEIEEAIIKLSDC